MILHRCFARDRASGARQRGGPLWIPRLLQGEGRHDNPAAYGCLYTAADPVAAVAETFAPLRGRRLTEAALRRERLPLALAALELPDDAELVDLDEPRVLARERLRPSLVATRHREVTQPQALTLIRRHDAAGLRWWSTHESTWANVTLFDRAAPRLRVREVRELSLGDPAVTEAAELLGLSLAA